GSWTDRRKQIVRTLFPSGDKRGVEGGSALTLQPSHSVTLRRASYALRRQARCSASRSARRRSAAVSAKMCRNRVSCAGVRATPRRCMAAPAVASSEFQSELSRSAPFHQLVKDGMYFGVSRPAGRRLHMTPTLVPVLMSVPSAVLVWSPTKQPTLLRPLA